MSGYIMDLRKVVGSRPLIMPAAGVVIVNSDGQILLQQRTDNECWGIPGGSMDLGESFEDTARREVREETGLEVGKLELLYVNSGKDAFYEYPNGDQVYGAAVVFTTTEFTGTVKLDPDETLDLRWFLPKSIPTNINPPDRPIIDSYVKHKGQVL